MGECGCGSNAPDFQFDGPDGVKYAVELYRGCNYCSTPVGIVIYRFTDPESIEMFLDGVPELPVINYGTKDYPSVDGEATFPIVDAEQLLKSLKKHVTEAQDLDPVASLEDLEENDVHYVLQEAIGETRQFWHRVRERAGS